MPELSANAAGYLASFVMNSCGITELPALHQFDGLFLLDVRFKTFQIHLYYLLCDCDNASLSACACRFNAIGSVGPSLCLLDSLLYLSLGSSVLGTFPPCLESMKQLKRIVVVQSNLTEDDLLPLCGLNLIALQVQKTKYQTMQY